MAYTAITLNIGTDRPEQSVQTQTRCLHSSRTISDKSTGSKMDLYKFKNEYSKEIRCPNT